MTVVVGHFDGITGAASLGVLLFFLISGFLMGKLYLETTPSIVNIRNYVVARVARVYPLFALIIVGTAALNTFSSAEVFGLQQSDVVSHLLLAGDAKTVWTISAEFQFYLAFIAIWLVRGYVGKTSAVVLSLLAVSAFIGFTIGYDGGRIALYKYLHLFVLGLAIAWLCNRDTSRYERIAGIVLPLAVVGFALVFFFFRRFEEAYFIYQSPVATLVSAALLTACVIARGNWVNRLLSLPIAIWLGEISFSVYLLHRHAEWIMDTIAGDVVPFWILTPVKILLTLALAQIAYKLIEVPARRALRGLGAKDTKVPLPSSAERTPPQ